MATGGREARFEQFTKKISLECRGRVNASVGAAGPGAPLQAATQPSGFISRAVKAGCFAKRSAGRIGRRTNSPPQFGQRPASTPSAQAAQKVHS